MDPPAGSSFSAESTGNGEPDRRMPFPLAILGTQRETAANLLRPYIEEGRLSESDAERTLDLVSADKTVSIQSLIVNSE